MPAGRRGVRHAQHRGDLGALLDSITVVERQVLEFRGRLIGILSARACADYEEQLAEGT